VPGALTIETVAEPHRSDAFVRLPTKLYADHPGFVPPLELMTRETLDPAKNAVFEHLEAAYFLALRDGRPVGRISAQVDSLAVETEGRRIGFFGFFDVADDAEVASALLETAETWLRARGAVASRGPISHTMTEEVGLLVDGFDARPVLMTPWHPPHAGRLVEAGGYDKARDVLCFDYDVGTARATHRAAAKAEAAGVVLRKLDPKDYSGDIARVVSIYNDAWSENWGFTPFTESEVAHLAAALKPIVDPELVVIVEMEGEAVAFAIALPNVLEAAEGLGGRLLPFGWAPFLWRLKGRGVSSCRMPLMGARKSLQTSLLGAVVVRGMLERIDEAMAAAGFVHSELSWILETNASMLAVLRSIGARAYKTHRIYEKPLG